MTMEWEKSLGDLMIYVHGDKFDGYDTVVDIDMKYGFRIEQMKWGVFLAPTIYRLKVHVENEESGSTKTVDCTDYEVVHEFADKENYQFASLELEPIGIDIVDSEITIEWRK